MITNKAISAGNSIARKTLIFYNGHMTYQEDIYLINRAVYEGFKHIRCYASFASKLKRVR